MSLLLVLATGVVFTGLLSFGLVRTGPDSGGWEWSASWTVLCATGWAAGSVPWPLGLGLGHAGFVVWVSLLYLGVLRFSGKGWGLREVGPLASLALASCASVFASETLAAVLSMLPALAVPFLAAREIRRSRHERFASSFDNALMMTLFFPATVGLVSLPFATSPDYPASLFFGWLIVLIGMAGMQLGALMSQVGARSEERRAALAALIEAVPVGLAISREPGDVAFANPMMREVLGYPENGSPVGEPMSRLVERLVGLGRAAGPPSAHSLLSDRHSRLDLDDGRELDVQVLPAPPRPGSVGGKVLVLRDITDERRLEAQLQRARQLETLGGLAGGVAHDFNNKLTSILGNAAMVSDELAPESPLQRALADVQQAAEYCSALTRDLLDFARATPRTPEAVEIEPLTERVLRALRPELPPGVSVRIDIDENASSVLADEAQLERVLTNLLTNARDAVGEHGQIRVHASESKDEPGSVVLGVSDDGPGIDPAHLERIFDPFFTTKPVGSGSGLGLAIVFGIAKAHGGDVRVESSSGAGACFCVIWPKADATRVDASEASRARVAGVAGRAPSVLLVDDEAPIRRLLQRTLEKAGYRVTVAADGPDGWKHFQQDVAAVDVAVVDLSMPGMDGDELLRLMWEQRPGLPAVLISGRLSEERVAALPDDLETVRKPFRPADLLRSLERVSARGAAGQGRT